MSLIKKWTELTVSTKIKALIYGQAGVGKTTIALSAPKPLFLDYDGGVHRVNHANLEGVDIVQISDYEDTTKILRDYDLAPYETIVFDTGGKMLDFMGAYIIKNNSKMQRGSGLLTLQGYGERKAMFSALIKQITLNLDKNIVFVAHRETQRDGDDIRYVPLFGGSNYDSLVTELDLVGYMEASGRKRTITFDPTSRNDGKNTCNLPSIVELPTIIDQAGKKIGENNFLTAVIQNYNDYTFALREQSIKIRELQKGVELALRNISTIDEMNLFVEEIQDMEHVGNSKHTAALLVNDKAKELGYKYDKKVKGYILINPVEEPAETQEND